MDISNSEDPTKFSIRFTQLAINALDETFDTMSISSVNRQIMKYISEYCSALNKDFFLRRINNLECNYKAFINIGNTTVCDDLNRVSYFYVKLGPYRLPIFQPGTIMFYSGVKKECPLEVFHANCGQNGPILGMGCGLFLARFMANLAFLYKDMCTTQNFGETDFVPHVYHEALLQCLKAFSREDADQHGRLKELQKMLCEIDDRVAAMDSEDEDQWDLHAAEEYKKSMSRKHSNTTELETFTEEYRYYSNWTTLFGETHPEKIEKRIMPTIKSALLNKKGIFDNDGCYKLVDVYFDKISKLLFSRRGTETEDSKMTDINNPNLSINKKNAYNDMDLSNNNMDMIKKEIDQNHKYRDSNNLQESQFLDNKPDMIEVKGERYGLNFDITPNQKLVEYFLKMKKSLRSLFVCSILSDQDLFQMKSGNFFCYKKTR